MTKPKGTEHLKPVSEPNTRLLTTKDVANRLQVSPRTVARLIEAGELSVKRIGRSVRITEEALTAFLHQGDTT